MAIARGSSDAVPKELEGAINEAMDSIDSSEGKTPRHRSAS